MLTLQFLGHLGLAYLCGALSWSVWIAHLAGGTDPRLEGDGNPGAANTFRSSGKMAGIGVVVLDYLKAFLPVGIAQHFFDYSGGEMLVIAVAPTIGHAFSVFLKMRGGRGLISMFGAWSGLTLYQVPLAMGAGAILSLILSDNDEVRSFSVLLGATLFLAITQAPLWMFGVVLIQALVLTSKLLVFWQSNQRKLNLYEHPS